MEKIEQIHDRFFKKVFSDPSNVKTFLEFILPKPIQNLLDINHIEFDPTSHVSKKYKESMSDIVARCKTSKDELQVDIYLLFEHKSFPDKNTLLQLLRYKYLRWQKDSDEDKPLRIIIPIVFYHGKKPWHIATQFVEQFSAPKDIKGYLLNFKYILFDTNDWDWQAESSQQLRDNIFLLSAMLLMKAAYQQNLEIVRQVFKLWHQIGFVKEKEWIIFFMIYLVQTQDIPEEQLAHMLEENKLEGEETMPTLAQRWEERGIEKGIEKGLEKGLEKGIEKGLEKGLEKGRKEGYILDKQNVLTMLLSTRFQLSAAEEQLIKAISDADKLDNALKAILSASRKQEVLNLLKKRG